MRPAKYVLLDPSGNRTALVTEWGGAEDEAEITRRLMKVSEQVAYLEAPDLPGAVARLRLMGGEFCGNASMAAAGWLIREELKPGEERTVPLEVSGAKGIVFCRIRGTEKGFEGTVEMPGILETWRTECGGIPLEAVRMEGIVHLIRESREPMEKDAAEALTRKLAEDGYDPKFGARPLRRLIQRTVEDTLSEELLQGRISLGQAVKLTVRDGQIVLDCAPQEAEQRETEQKETEQKDPTPAGEEPAGETTTTEEE